MTMRVLVLVFALCTGVAGPGRLAAQSGESERVRVAATVFEEVMSAPDNAIPQAILRRAEAVAVFPGTIKGGFIFGGHRGKGIISVRHADTGGWSAPAFLTLTGGSFGLQIGGQSADLVLVIMNRRGLDKLLQNQFKIGADVSAVAGPLGRDAEASTDLFLQAEILSYSRTRGIFAGVTLKGSSIRADEDANERFYGEKLDTRAVTMDGRAGTPADDEAAGAWGAVLAKYHASR